MTFLAFFRRSDLSRLDALRLIVQQPVIKPLKPHRNLIVFRGPHHVWEKREKQIA